ncbi:MAG: YhfC family intramembrane metalloprotease [Treponema sp.]|uniref:YhfC family intramembrane metalloprotease n=1 Tax=Treponema sp. TaxID=166 RepID=UPI00298E7154|nr:YhfC family glutamic-type intramembrane protease [Treponema sp.]MCQ2600869.1 YhfC family intramembrane metalloprotease [Treponema sp.]
MVKFSSIFCMLVALIAGLVIPLILILVINKKIKASLKPFFTGCVTFVLFALVIEGTFNFLIFNRLIGVEKMMALPTWLFAIIGGLMAGIFEETGRYVAFRTFLKKDLSNIKTPFVYGAGHGGVEAFIILVSVMATNLVIAFLINKGNSSILLKDASVEQVGQILKMIETVKTTSPVMYLVSIFERLTTIALHILLSVIVWYAAKNKKIQYYFAAILLHAFVDFCGAVLMGKIHLMWVEVVLILVTSMVGLFAIAIWYHEDKDPEMKRQAELELQNDSNQ